MCLEEQGYLEAGEVNEKMTGKEVGEETGLGVLKVKEGENFKTREELVRGKAVALETFFFF